MAKRRRNNNNFNRKRTKEEHRINERIRIPEIRIVGDNLEEVSKLVGEEIKPGTIYQTRKAKSLANRAELDLVEISPNAKPPVCRIIDYKKFLYERKKRNKELKAKQSKTVIKEIRFGPNTGDHDFDFKLRQAKSFLEDGAKVKAYVQFRGRTIVFKERGELLLLRFLQELEDYGAAESLPKMEGRRMFCFVAPHKGGVRNKKKDKKEKETS